jgi:hypothetical protein
MSNRRKEMNRIKSLVGLAVIFGVIFMGASSARAGILMSDFGDDQPCTTSTSSKSQDNVDRGIMVSGLSIIFGDAAVDAWFGKSTEVVDCGIMVSG